ncbi:hypothetical protein ACFQU1_20825 [Chelatococcus sp. GCM10030263]|uniref:hypothetical protein n=1 Tax=Chelatococcus sp. GCM10030263 TaxID=3273387 RepID=UPI00361193A1
MIVICLLVGCLMVAGGVTAVTTGMGIIVLERGWSMVISGSVVATGGALLIGIALLIREIRRLPTQIATFDQQEEWETADAEGRHRHIGHHHHAPAPVGEPVPPSREAPAQAPAEQPVAAAPAASAIAAAAVAAAFDLKASARDQADRTAAAPPPAEPAHTTPASNDLDRALASVEEALAANFDLTASPAKDEETEMPQARDFAFDRRRDRAFDGEAPEPPSRAPDFATSSGEMAAESQAPAEAPKPRWFSERFSRWSGSAPVPQEEAREMPLTPAEPAFERDEETPPASEERTAPSFAAEPTLSPQAAPEPAPEPEPEPASELRAERSDVPPASVEKTAEQAAAERKARWSLFRRRPEADEHQETDDERAARIAAAALAITPKPPQPDERPAPDLGFDISGLRRGGDDRFASAVGAADETAAAEPAAAEDEPTFVGFEEAQQPAAAVRAEEDTEATGETRAGSAPEIDDDVFFAGISHQEAVVETEAMVKTDTVAVAEPEPAAPEAETEMADLAVEEEPAASEFIPDPVPTVVGTYSAGGNLYVMFSDGSIEAETSRGTFRFRSLDELKAYVAASEQGGTEEQPQAAPAEAENDPEDDRQLEPEGSAPWTTPKANP